MCGIFGYVGEKDNAAEIVLNGLKKLEYRGYDSWGIAVSKKNQNGSCKILTEKHVGKIANTQGLKLPASHLALGHTRWATHGGVTETNAHPHIDCTKRFAVVHNGIIENYELLQKKLSKKHHLFSQTDTEIMVHLIEDYAQKHSGEEAVRLAFNQATGLNAIIVLDVKENKIIAAKTGSPVVIAVSKDSGYLASDSASLLSVSQNLLFLADNEMAVISGNKVLLKDMKSGQDLPLHLEKVDWNTVDSSLGKYSFFMLKEIEEQPKVIINSATNLTVSVEKLAKKLRPKNIYLTGCGSAYFAGLCGTYFLSQISNVKSQTIVASETELFKLMGRKDCLIALSQSGETIDLIETVKFVKQLGCLTVGAVNVLGSTLYRLVNEKILLGAGPEKAVCATKSWIAKLSFLILLSYAMANATKSGQKLLTKTAEGVEEVINQKIKIKNLAKKISLSHNIFIIGRGVAYPAALESALKIKEVSYRHAEGFAGGELKHGVIALVEKGTPCFILNQNDQTGPAVLANAMELKARGAYVIGLGPKNQDVFDLWLPCSDLGEATIIPMVVYMQLLAYYMSLELNLDPDKPRNLAKSVTVK